MGRSGRSDASELADAVVVDFPLRGRWSAAHSPATRIPSHGTNQLGQRYAFDLWRLDDRKHPHPAGALRTWLVGVRIRECYGWGEPVHAAMDGRVVRARDGREEDRWLYPVWEILKVIGNAISFRATERGINRIAGNHVVVAGEEAHAFYAHLAPGTVAVTEGQAVRRGEILAGWAARGTRPLHTFTSSSWIAPTCSPRRAFPARSLPTRSSGRIGGSG